jgi:hypothetical protein
VLVLVCTPSRLRRLMRVPVSSSVVSEPEEESLSSGGGAGRLRIAEALLPRFLKAGTVGAASVMAGGVASVLFRLSKELF